MKDFDGNNILTQLHAAYRTISALQKNPTSPQKTSQWIRQNEYQIRTGCFTIRAAKREWQACPKNEYGSVSVLDAVHDFCDLSDYRLSAEAITAFFRQLAKNESLTYAEIACLIPAAEYCCILMMAGMLPGNKQENAAHSLTMLTSFPCEKLSEELSQTEHVLERDPIFCQLDERSKNEYRARIIKIARKAKISEREAAVALLKQCAQHSGKKGQIGYYLFPERKNQFYYPILAITSIFFIACSFLFSKTWFALFAIIPSLCGAKQAVDSIFSHIIRPRRGVKLHITDQNCPQSAVTIVSAIKGISDAKKLLHRIDVLSAQIPEKKIAIGLLLDFAASPTEECPEDLDVLAYFQQEFNLRNRNTNRFFCAIRRRTWNENDFRFQAKGRKQGALIDFCDLIEGETAAFRCVFGQIPNAVYLLPLDEDTQPTPGSVEGLIGFMEHPNHHPVLCDCGENNVFVKEGYAAAMPRIEPNPANCYRTPYSSVYAGNAGTEYYHNPHFHLYQDLFSEGIFCGKGIFRVSEYRKIAERFRTEPVLSHDLPEGEFLRCAAVTDLVFFDDIPSNPVSDFRRRNRWIRGDVQNSVFFSLRKKTATHFRFKIFDNILRNLCDPFLFLLWIPGAFGVSAAIYLTLFWTVFPVLIALPDLFFTLLHHRRIFHPFQGFSRILSECGFHLLFLPTSAATAADGMLRGTIRTITGKKRLEWTTSAQSSGGIKTISEYVYAMSWQECGFLFLFSFFTLPVGICWLFAPLIAWWSAQEKKVKPVFSAELQEWLKQSWNYYVDFVTEKNHFLPPDNYQQEPLNTAAPRTSPTNIGMYFLSVVGAHDLGLIPKEEMFSRLDDTLTTLEVIPKWRGHLYNWYDIESLKVLSPHFISTVDSGNCAACLYTAAKALDDIKEPPASSCARRIRTLLAAADFKDFYDEQKDLFTIGCHANDEEQSDCYYDLYASESRLTSFYAVMTGNVPVRHWEKLNRPAEKKSGELCVNSWSGTMFEYFMPHLFLPVFPHTLGALMLTGAYYRQVAVSGGVRPWGISESQFYSFDRSLNYQYRAFGLSDLALRRDLNFPAIVSSYSSYLTYPFFPAQAQENLKKQPTGKYGHYEAVDYRNGNENPRVVYSYMAHHLGMSFLAGVNYLRNGIMQKRFMDVQGEAYQSLLTEQVPQLSRNYYPRRNIVSTRQALGVTESDRPDPENPKSTLLTNEQITELITDSGIGILRQRNVNLTRFSADVTDPVGTWTFVRHKGRMISSTYAPLYQSKINYRALTDDSGVTYYADAGNFELRTTLSLPTEFPVSVRELVIKNNQMTGGTFEFFFYLEPVLCPEREYDAHPEYRDLFLRCEYDEEYRVVLFRRLTQDGEKWLAVTASEHFRFDCRRDAFESMEQIGSSLSRGAEPFPLHPALILRGNCEIRGRGTQTIVFYTAYGDNRASALNAIRKTAAQPMDVIRRRYAQAETALCERTEIQAPDRVLLDYILSRCFFDRSSPSAPPKVKNSLPRNALWKHGVSGDFPIIALRVGTETVGQILPFLKASLLLSRAGIDVDFVFIYREKQDYHSPLKGAIESLFLTVEPEKKQHLYAVNIHSVEEYSLFQKCSVLFVNLERGWKIRKPRRSFCPVLSLPPVPERDGSLWIECGRGGFTKKGTYRIPKERTEPLRPWSLILANRKFGTVINERSVGWSFSGNAAENRITPRLPAYTHSDSAEKLYLLYRGNRYDLLRNAEAEFQPGKATYYSSAYGVEITTEIAVPVYLKAKIIRIKVKNTGNIPLEILYRPDVILGNNRSTVVNRSGTNDVIFYNNPFNSMFGDGVAILFGKNVVSDGGALHGKVAAQENKTLDFVLGYAEGFHSAEQLRKILTGSGRIDTELKKAIRNGATSVTIETPDKELDCFFNSFLQPQILFSRLYSRTGPSQPGGAYGFRDQLQDALCLSLTRPEFLKRQIMRCCAKQFEEGDVLHWWHPASGKTGEPGIRTRFSDDPFWLVYACCIYWESTGDKSFFERKIPYLTAPELSEEETDRYFVPEISTQRESVYHHAIKAFRRGLRRGRHGLISFGSGDWNDGMNRIGADGETVWGTMFALICAERFQPISHRMSNWSDEEYLKTTAEELRAALCNCSFDQDRFLRGYDGQGRPFGVDKNRMTIDLLPQIFSVFCGMEKAWQNAAMDAVRKLLYRPEEKTVLLLTPPYSLTEDRFPGSIAEYPPGVRENGGQYTHAAVWYALACLQRGEADFAAEILDLLNPINHCKTKDDCSVYGAEPYVLCGDVYSLQGHKGEGGWSHYTGAAGWYYRTVIGELLGIKRKENRLTVQPKLPSAWNGCKATVLIGTGTYTIRIERGNEKGMYDGGVKTETIVLDGKNHNVVVIL